VSKLIDDKLVKAASASIVFFLSALFLVTIPNNGVVQANATVDIALSASNSKDPVEVRR
jgi:hypothetical protein